MNNDQKEILRDCFEGCLPFPHAVAIIADPTVTEDAMATWWRWTREMEEEGYYTF